MSEDNFKLQALGKALPPNPRERFCSFLTYFRDEAASLAGLAADNEDITIITSCSVTRKDVSKIGLRFGRFIYRFAKNFRVEKENVTYLMEMLTHPDFDVEVADSFIMQKVATTGELISDVKMLHQSHSLPVLSTSNTPSTPSISNDSTVTVPDKSDKDIKIVAAAAGSADGSPLSTESTSSSSSSTFFTPAIKRSVAVSQATLASAGDKVRPSSSTIQVSNMTPGSLIFDTEGQPIDLGHVEFFDTYMDELRQLQSLAEKTKLRVPTVVAKLLKLNVDEITLITLEKSQRTAIPLTGKLGTGQIVYLYYDDFSFAGVKD